MTSVFIPPYQIKGVTKLTFFNISQTKFKKLHTSGASWEGDLGSKKRRVSRDVFNYIHEREVIKVAGDQI